MQKEEDSLGKALESPAYDTSCIHLVDLAGICSIWRRDSHFRNSDISENSISEEGKMQDRF